MTPAHANFLRQLRPELDRLDEVEAGRLDSLLRGRLLSTVPGEQTPLARAFTKYDLSRCGRLDYESFRKAIQTLGLEADFTEDQVGYLPFGNQPEGAPRLTATNRIARTDSSPFQVLRS